MVRKTKVRSGNSKNGNYVFGSHLPKVKMEPELPITDDSRLILTQVIAIQSLRKNIQNLKSNNVYYPA